MKRLLTLLRTFCETYFGVCHLYVNSRGHITGNIRVFWFTPRDIDVPASSYRVFTDHVSIATFTPPSILTHINYVLPTTKPKPLLTPHTPIRPIAPCTETIHLDLPNNTLPTL